MDERVWKDLLERYGQKVTLMGAEGEVSVRAFFQPVKEKKDGEAATAIGIRPLGKHLYLGPADVAVEEGEEVRWNGASFRFHRVRCVPVGDKIAYRWGLCEELDRGDET